MTDSPAGDRSASSEGGHAFEGWGGRRVAVERSPVDPAMMHAVGRELGRLLRPGELVLLFGELGAGKTTLVRGIAAGVGLDPAEVSSPTFVLCQEYRSGDAPTIAHVDAWRMHDAGDLESIGWDELRRDRSIIICLEWPERVIGAIGDPMRVADVVTVEIEHAENGRIVRVHLDEARAARFQGGGGGGAGGGAGGGGGGGGTSDSNRDGHSNGESESGAANPADGRDDAAARFCRTCGARIESPHGAEGRDRGPFCSSRCQMADLHRWFSGDYRIERELNDDDSLQE